MQVQILGTAAAEGIPALFCDCDNCTHARTHGGKNVRTRSGTLIDTDIMLDFSPDTYLHALTHKLRLSEVKHIFITHSHGDHFYPSDLDLRRPPFAHYTKRPPMTVYGNENVIEICEKELEWEHLKPYLKLQQVHPLTPVKIDEATTVTPLPALHGKDKEPFIYLIERDGKSVLYGHDTGIFPEATWQALKAHPLDLVLLDCTFMTMRDGHNHMGIPDNAQVRTRMLNEGIANESTTFVVTHFSHNGGLNHEQLTAAANENGFQCAHDGVVYKV